MRVRFKPTPVQRFELLARLARLQQPDVALKIVRTVSGADFNPATAHCTVQSIHSDRFVVRVQARAQTGEERGYALKVYSDDFGRKVWEYSRALVEHNPPSESGLCLPIHYLPLERMLVFPWVDGLFLSEIVDEPKPDLLRLAAKVAAKLHCLNIISDAPTTVQMMVDETRARNDRLRNRWPETAPIIEPLMAALDDVSTGLSPADPAPVHGDMAAGQFLWTGKRLVLLDLDMFGYADPAYDAGHFLAQLERRCLFDPTLPAHAWHWLACFRDAYLKAVPQVSPRNVSFYRGLTLTRKIYTICRIKPEEWPQMIPQLARRALAALREVASPADTQQDACAK